MTSKLKDLVRRLVRRAIGDPEVRLEEMPDAPAIFNSYRGLLANGHRRVPGGWIYQGEFYPDYLTVGGNTRAIQRTALRWCRGTGVDVGAAFWLFPGSLPVDTEIGPGLENRIEDVPAGSQDYVFSSHCLEHIADWGAALDLWVSKLLPGGVLFLYLPHPSCGLWRMENPAMRGIHVWVPDHSTVREALVSRGLEIVAQDEGPDHFFSFYLVGRKAAG